MCQIYHVSPECEEERLNGASNTSAHIRQLPCYPICMASLRHVFQRRMTPRKLHALFSSGKKSQLDIRVKPLINTSSSSLLGAYKALGIILVFIKVVYGQDSSYQTCCWVFFSGCEVFLYSQVFVC